MGAIVNTEGKGFMSIALTGVVGTGNGGIGSVPNPEGVDLLITRSYLYVSANSAGAANLSAGIGATPTSAATDIINALAMAAAAGKYYNGQAQQVSAKTEVTAPAVWSAGKYLNLTGSADSTGLVGTLYVEYIRP